MITCELKNRINSLWEIFCTGGIPTPLDVVEQMTYLMFIHDLDETDSLRARESTMPGLPHQSVFTYEPAAADLLHGASGPYLETECVPDFA